MAFHNQDTRASNEHAHLNGSKETGKAPPPDNSEYNGKGRDGDK
jgi:hypothetical protein